MKSFWKWLASLWRKPIVIKPPVVVVPPVVPTAPPVEPPVVPVAGCGCDLSQPFVREQRVEGQRNKYEGTRFWRLANRCSDGQWQAISPDFDWIKGCIQVDGRTLTCSCDPARGAHFYGYRLDGDDDSYSAPSRKERVFVTKNPFTSVQYERRKVNGKVVGSISGHGDDAVVPSSGNVPPFLKEYDIPAPRNPPHAPQDAPKNIHGTMRAANAAQATQIRFGLQGYFRGEGYSVGYPTPDNPRHGSICVSWPTDLPKDKPRDVKWEVLP